jgi:signal transduction histidine kinase
VLQCLIRAKQKLTPAISPPELDDALDAIHTVMLCSNHQKRIIDDTLTMSKLDSRLLLVTPVDTQPVKVVGKAMKMFENDFANKDISAQLVVDPSYYALGIDWVKADPSRFTQVLVNLLTNGTYSLTELIVAIKFTAGRPVRNVTVTVGPVSTSRPGIHATDEIISSPNIQLPMEREKIFITFSVTDTGSGLSDDERALLFQRFTQAKPETHVTYGGSGLGLYICRKLTELQGGQITVQSRQGEGSTFSFYIEAKFAAPPMPVPGEKLDPMTLAAAELTNARTEASFLPNNLIHGKGQRLSDSRRSSADNKPSYSILIVEVQPS